MQKNIKLNKTQINAGAICVWILGGIIAFALITIALGDLHLKDILKILYISLPNGANTFYLLYLSVPFLVLAVLTKIIFRGQNMPEKLFLLRFLGIVCSFIAMEWFYYAYTVYLRVEGNMFSIVTALYVFVPFINLLLLPVAYMVGYLVGIFIRKNFIDKWQEVKNMSIKDLK